MDWARILAYITGTVDQELLLRNEYLAAENRILKGQLKTPLRFTDAERISVSFFMVVVSSRLVIGCSQLQLNQIETTASLNVRNLSYVIS